MKISSRGYWENPTAEGHGTDMKLALAVGKFFKDNNVHTVLDAGCGTGFYSQYLSKGMGIGTLAVDGNPNTFQLTDGLGRTVDLSKPQDLGLFDWVLCLEVGEHIPLEYEKIFLENLDRHNNCGIVLSWAIRGQGGDGHVNCLDNWEVIEKVERLGYQMDMESTVKLRQSCAEYPNTGWWFRNTLMVFRKVNIVCSQGYDMSC